jgi:endonuclease-8
MPEGDTIFRAATKLRAMVGQTVVEAWSGVAGVDLGSLVGDRIDAVTSRGKNLLMEFASGRTLVTHLGLHGAWRLAPAQRGRPSLRVAVGALVRTDELLALCLRTSNVQLASAWQLRHHRGLMKLGLDLLAGDFDPEAAEARLRSHPDMPLLDALLDQTVLAGIGNIFKSEILFLCGVSPFRTVQSLDDATLSAIVATSRKLLTRNVGRGPRTTARYAESGQRYWVYGRARQPCLKCGHPIQFRSAGRRPRSTYFCPLCQS